MDFINIVQERRSFSMKQGALEKIMRCVFYINTTATKSFQSILEAVLKLMLSKMTFLFFNWDSHHARLNNHYEAWSYKKKSTKKTTGYRKSV